MRRARSLLLSAACWATWLLGPPALRAEPGRLPPFRVAGVALEPRNLRFAPRGGLERAAVIEVEGRLADPLGRYYLYYSAHRHAGIGLAYADSLDGPWIEHPGNPLIGDVAIPDVLWIEASGRLHLWAHGRNSHTDLWTSRDGLSFLRHSTSIRAEAVHTRNATYTRTYVHPLERFGSRYVMLYSGLNQASGIRAIWLAHSADGTSWTQMATPLVEPGPQDTRELYDPALLSLGGRTFVLYQNASAHRGGSIRYVEIHPQLYPIGPGGQRFVLLDAEPGPPVNGRFRGSQVHQEGGRLVLFTGASTDPGVIIHATAELDPAGE